MGIYVNGSNDGRRVTLGPMEVDEAVNKALELRDGGYFRVTLKDGMTGVEHDIEGFIQRDPGKLH